VEAARAVEEAAFIFLALGEVCIMRGLLDQQPSILEDAGGALEDLGTEVGGKLQWGRAAFQLGDGPWRIKSDGLWPFHAFKCWSAFSKRRRIDRGFPPTRSRFQWFHCIGSPWEF